MSEQQKLEKSKKRTKICMITITVLFIFIMLVVPLVSVMASALKEGFGFYFKAVSTEYVVSARYAIKLMLGGSINMVNSRGYIRKLTSDAVLLTILSILQ